MLIAGDVYFNGYIFLYVGNPVWFRLAEFVSSSFNKKKVTSNTSFSWTVDAGNKRFICGRDVYVNNIKIWTLLTYFNPHVWNSTDPRTFTDILNVTLSVQCSIQQPFNNVHTHSHSYTIWYYYMYLWWKIQIYLWGQAKTSSFSMFSGIPFIMRTLGSLKEAQSMKYFTI